MTEVVRYDMVVTELRGGPWQELRPAIEGDWVLWDDYIALRVHVVELEQYNTNLKRLADSQEFRAEQAEGTMRERVEQDQQLAHQLAAVTARVAELEAENNALIQEIAQAESDLGITQRQLAAMTLTWMPKEAT